MAPPFDAGPNVHVRKRAQRAETGLQHTKAMRYAQCVQMNAVSSAKQTHRDVGEYTTANSVFGGSRSTERIVKSYRAYTDDTLTTNQRAARFQQWRTPLCGADVNWKKFVALGFTETNDSPSRAIVVVGGATDI